MGKQNNSLSIVMPAYNEVARLPATVNEFAQWVEKNSNLNIELIIVNDGSTDETEKMVLSYCEQYPWMVLINENHVGMMSAIISGIRNAKYNLIGTLEADSPVHPNYFLSFLPFMDDTDIIIGSRFLGRDIKGKSLARRIVSKVNSMLFTSIFACPIKDPQISFRIYNKASTDIIMPLLVLNHDGFKSTEIAVKAYGLGLRVKEMPVEYTHNIDSKAVPGGIESIKVTFFALYALFRLWIITIREYSNGLYSVCPIRGSAIIKLFGFKK